MSLAPSNANPWKASLRYALERQELVLHYQPKVNLKTRAITSVEALVRWQHPERGLLLPDQFLTIAEDTGMIVPIGQWVLREACRQMREWLDAGPAGRSGGRQHLVSGISQRAVSEGVQTALKEARLDPTYLELELTETVLMRIPSPIPPCWSNSKPSACASRSMTLAPAIPA
jgi:EAL domain-containing protein (putative c-di-GMP-specific phosphodiesterase class I)